VQLGRSTTDVRARALAEVRVARRAATERAPGLDLIALALNSKTMGFEKVTAMIDKMVEVLKSEQQGDDQKKEYCEAEFDQSDDKKKALETKASDEAQAAQLAEESIASLTEEIKALNAGIKELDKDVADATELRKQQNAAYTELMALDTQAKELLGLAKNRLNQYYNPKLYIPPPKKELTREEAVYQTVVPAEDTPALMQDQAKPAPPPETFEGAYKKKGEATNGVIAMVDMLVADLDKEMTVASTEEKEAQKDYETLMADAKAKRAADTKSVTQKEASKATLEGELQTHKDEKAAADKELAGLSEYISGLHAECDWLLKYFAQRKDARANEVENLNNAKAVLAGADYSLVQLHDRHQLRSNSKGCGPQVSVSFSATEDAAGTAVFGENEALSDGACNPVGGAIKLVKFCGPGTLTLSRMTCNNHEYLPHTYEHKASEYTTNCETISTQDTNVEGHLGSWSVKC
jgi:septal ring factor EnvC (AmiA/AmiB activator)